MLFIFKIGNFPHSLSWYTSEYRRIFVKKVGKFASVILVENSAIQVIKLNKICIIDRSNEIQVAEDLSLEIKKGEIHGISGISLCLDQLDPESTYHHYCGC